MIRFFAAHTVACLLQLFENEDNDVFRLKLLSRIAEQVSVYGSDSAYRVHDAPRIHHKSSLTGACSWFHVTLISDAMRAH